MGQTSVRDFYTSAAQREWRRLARDAYHRLELETTLHFLKRHLPDGGLILDAGGGPGRYTIALAGMGYRVVLLDLTPDLLAIARRRIARAGLRDNIASVEEGSIVDLSRFGDAVFDAVVCLGGPLSHVEGEAGRARATAELARVARPGAPVAISVMGRLAVLAAAVRYWPEWIAATAQFEEVVRTGDDYAWCGTSYAHFFLDEELETLLAGAGLTIVERVGLEGLGSPLAREINRLARHHPETWRTWQRTHLSLCTNRAVFATSDHMLVVGLKS